MAYSRQVDGKWQKRWEEEKLYRFNPDADNKLYCLEMFSYPSGAQLHVGHWYNYGLADIWARAKKMQGYNLFHPVSYTHLPRRPNASAANASSWPLTLGGGRTAADGTCTSMAAV